MPDSKSIIVLSERKGRKEVGVNSLISVQLCKYKGVVLHTLHDTRV